MIYSYTQLSHYLACPRRYRYRYVDGWREKDSRASMLFGRAFELALAAYFRREDSTEVLFREWSQYQNTRLDYSHNDTWDRMLQQGTKLLELFAQHDRLDVPRPRRNLQVRVARPLSPTSQFVGYVDALGYVDGIHSVIDWKTTSARFPEEPEGLVALDPQLVCYSWLTGYSEVAFVVFVRKRLPEIQYLRTTISDKQRQEFGQLVEDAVSQIEGSQFLPHSGIRFPQNSCPSCSYLGLCLNNPPLVEAKLLRQPPGGDLGWLDQLDY
jgi:CRISPR/Cas system-associated exonuclease Cas4 (RecB family)